MYFNFFVKDPSTIPPFKKKVLECTQWILKIYLYQYTHITNVYLSYIINNSPHTLWQSTLYTVLFTQRNLIALWQFSVWKPGWLLWPVTWANSRKAICNSGLRGIYSLSETPNIVLQILMFFNKKPGSPICNVETVKGKPNEQYGS
jgi:hypothetical protein